jgi:hypothetical protein
MSGGVCTTLSPHEYERAIEVFYRHDNHPQQLARFVRDQVTVEFVNSLFCFRRRRQRPALGAGPGGPSRMQCCPSKPFPSAKEQALGLACHILGSKYCVSHCISPGC